MRYYNDGAAGALWEPLYRRRVELTPCEQILLTSPALRRLQAIGHYGAAARILPLNHTRYMHTLGVFTLAAYFRPDDQVLRAARGRVAQWSGQPPIGGSDQGLACAWLPEMISPR